MTTALSEVDNGGRFIRTAAGFREIISKSHPTFQPAKDRYHLYISLACPWANRCLATVHFKGLKDCIGVSIVHPTWQRTRPEDANDSHTGWVFDQGALSSSTGMGHFKIDGCTIDPINHVKSIRDLYELSQDSRKKFSVPILWDKQTSTIVNNESSEILRIFTKEFNEYATGPYKDYDLYPEALQTAIEEANEWIYPSINDGVYRCGFAKTQEAYNEAIQNLSYALDRLELLLSKSRYVIGNTLTEADIRLFMTLARYDEVYVVYFKCNHKRLIDYPNIRHYCRDLYQTYGIGETINMEHIKTHYYTSHPALNTYAIIPAGPDVINEFKLSHDRATRSYN